MTYFLCEAGARLRAQIDARWPKRDRASDGWIGDASHAAVVSDHNPCWGCTGDSYGVVRAIDIDSDLDPKDPTAAGRLANQLRKCAQDGADNGRINYIIFNRQITSGTYTDRFWTWRPYTGSDPHTNHIHVSFTAKGDHRGGPFPLPIFDEVQKQRLRDRIAALTKRVKTLLANRRQARRELEELLK